MFKDGPDRLGNLLGDSVIHSCIIIDGDGTIDASDYYFLRRLSSRNGMDGVSATLSRSSCRHEKKKTHKTKNFPP